MMVFLLIPIRNKKGNGFFLNNNDVGVANASKCMIKNISERNTIYPLWEVFDIEMEED